MLFETRSGLLSANLGRRRASSRGRNTAGQTLGGGCSLLLTPEHSGTTLLSQRAPDTPRGTAGCGDVIKERPPCRGPGSVLCYRSGLTTVYVYTHTHTGSFKKTTLF